MDVDVVVRRALVYAMTTVAIAMMIGAVALGLVFLAVGNNLSTQRSRCVRSSRSSRWRAIVMLSEPLKKFLQERADRFFYGERYDLRQGLLDFGRTLSATTALDPLLDGLTERLRQVLDVQKVAVFIEDEDAPSIIGSRNRSGLSEEYTIPADFRDMIRQKSAAKGVVRADEFDLQEIDVLHGNGTARIRKLPVAGRNFIILCRASCGGKMVAVIGLGRATDGSLLRPKTSKF